MHTERTAQEKVSCKDERTTAEERNVPNSRGNMLVDMLVGDETQGVRWSSSRAKGRGQVRAKEVDGWADLQETYGVAPRSWSELRIRL